MSEYAFLNAETTGLGSDAEATEIAVMGTGGDVLFESYCRPTVPVEEGAFEVHGISLDKLKTAPSWPEIEGEFRAALEGRKVVVFNAEFGVRILKQTARAHGEIPEWIGNLRAICAMKKAAQIYGATNRYETISFGSAVYAAGIAWRGIEHSACGDAATTESLWWTMKKVVEKRERARAAAQKRRDLKAAKLAKIDSKKNRLSVQERKDIEALRELADWMLCGETGHIDNQVVSRLRKMGISLTFFTASQCGETVRGKGRAFRRYSPVSTHAGQEPHRCYMPWQLRE